MTSPTSTRLRKTQTEVISPRAKTRKKEDKNKSAANKNTVPIMTMNTETASSSTGMPLSPGKNVNFTATLNKAPTFSRSPTQHKNPSPTQLPSIKQRICSPTHTASTTNLPSPVQQVSHQGSSGDKDIFSTLPGNLTQLKTQLLQCDVKNAEANVNELQEKLKKLRANKTVDEKFIKQIKNATEKWQSFIDSDDVKKLQANPEIQTLISQIDEGLKEWTYQWQDDDFEWLLEIPAQDSDKVSAAEKSPTAEVTSPLSPKAKSRKRTPERELNNPSKSPRISTQGTPSSQSPIGNASPRSGIEQIKRNKNLSRSITSPPKNPTLTSPTQTPTSPRTTNTQLKNVENE